MITERINIDVRPGGVPVVIHVTQYEAGLRRFIFTPYTSNGTQTVVAGSATLEGTKPDGYAFQQACEMIDGVITYTLQEQLCAVPGRVWSRLVIRDTDGGMIGYTAIVWVVGCAGVKDGAVMSDSDISALRQFLDEFGSIDAYRGALDQVIASTQEQSDRLNQEVMSRTEQDTVLSARMDEFSHLPDGSLSTSADAELVDIRVEADGTTAASAGDAVRDQVGKLKNDIIYGRLNQHIKTNPFVTGTISTLGAVAPVRSALTVQEDGSLKCARNSSSSTVSYGFYFRIETDPLVNLTGHKIYFNISGFDHTGAVNYSNLRYNGAYGSTAQGGFQTDVVDVPEVYETIFTPNANVDRLTVLLIPGSTVSNGEYFTIGSMQVIDLTAMFGAGNEPSLEVFKAIYGGDIPYSFRVPGIASDTKMTEYLIDKQREKTFYRLPDIVTDADLNDLTDVGFQLLYAGHTYTNWPAGLSAGSAWLFTLKNTTNVQIVQILIRNTTGEAYYRRKGNTSWYAWIKYYTDDSLFYKDLAGKKVSIVGDSISTYQGYNPSDYAYYYPREDLDNVSKTWWQQVITKAGMSLVTNASWSGSWVCYDSSVSADSAKVAYTDARVNALADGTTTPDIIIVLIGTNDFIHNGGNPIGVLDMNSELPGEASPITEFKPAYATMINKIRTTYPHAHVYCCTLIERYRGTDTEYPIKNGNGVSLASYNSAIVDVANWMGCRIIRLDTVFSLGEVPEMTVDGTLHPNAAGAKLIANKVLAVLSEEEKALIV